jgi:hypothetical protein
MQGRSCVLRVHCQVWTELVQCGQYEFGAQGRFFINAIAETPETVALDVVPRLREFSSSPGTHECCMFCHLACMRTNHFPFDLQWPLRKGL